MISYPEASSTCYLVALLIEQMWGEEYISREMAENIFVGMMTDTGNFAFSSVTPDVFRMVSILAAKGISIPDIHNFVYNSFTEGRARLFGYVIDRKMKIFHNGTVDATPPIVASVPFGAWWPVCRVSQNSLMLVG